MFTATAADKQYIHFQSLVMLFYSTAGTPSLHRYTVTPFDGGDTVVTF
jgi:hypothetical protein